MMKVLVNGELKELDYSRNGADCTNDFVEAAQYQYDDESGAYIMDSDTFDFWEEAIEKQEELDRLIAEYPQYESEFLEEAPGEYADALSAAESGIAWYSDRIHRIYNATMAALRGQADSIDYEWLNGYETEGTAADIVSQAKDHGEQITEAEAQEILEEYRNR